jgi:predicted Zn-dependent peptidase
VRLSRRRLPLLRETVFRCELGPDGLPAVLVPKPGLTRKTAILAARYGSLDVEFEQGGGIVSTPPGVAHFLEHQLFKKHGGDALMEFSRYGATSNAFTDYTMTAYYFVCSEQFEESLDELFRLVFRPEFVADRVEKEKAIIRQELNMYLDMPGHRAYQNLVESMYRRHPVRLDIGGTVESIQAVTPETLDLCYRAFYAPANVTLVMAGDLDPARTFRAAQKSYRRVRAGARPAPPIARRIAGDEPGVARTSVSIDLAVSRPRVLIGIKDRVGPETPVETARRDLENSLALDLLLGRASAFFSREYESGLINDDFAAAYIGSETFGFAVIEAETEEPDRLVAAVRREIARGAAERLSRADLGRLQRKIAGRFIRSFDSPESSAFVLLESLHRRVELQALIDMVFEIRPADLLRRIQGLARQEAWSVSRVVPKTKRDK